MARKGALLALCLSAAVAAADFDVVNEAEFKKLFPGTATVRKVAGGLQFTEGPVWIAAGGGYLVFSDIPANELKRWDAARGVTTFRTPSGSANGNVLDREGRLVTAEHSGRVSRTEADGTVVTLVDSVDGKRLSSPNDVVVTADGAVWFTDPDYGLGGRQKETPGNYVYRYDPASETALAVIRDTDRPNGLCFSPDERTLYVADSGKPRHIRAFPVQGTTVGEGRVFATIDRGAPDGIRCDEGGRVWSSAGDGVQIFGSDGRLIGRVLVPEAAANLTFGGADGRTLYVTARTSLYAIDTLVRQAGRPAR